MALDDASRRNPGAPGRPAPALPSQAARPAGASVTGAAKKPAPPLPSRAAKPSPPLPSKAANSAAPGAARPAAAPIRPAPFGSPVPGARPSVAPPAAPSPIAVPSANVAARRAPVAPVAPVAPAPPVQVSAPVPAYDEDDGEGMTMVRGVEIFAPEATAPIGTGGRIPDFGSTEEHSLAPLDEEGPGDSVTMIAGVGPYGAGPGLRDTAPVDLDARAPHFSGADPFGGDPTELSALPFVSGRAPAPAPPAPSRAPAPAPPAPTRAPAPREAAPAPAPPAPMPQPGHSSRVPADRPSRSPYGSAPPPQNAPRRAPDFDARPPALNSSAPVAASARSSEPAPLKPLRSVPPSPFDPRVSEPPPPRRPDFLTSAASNVLPDAYREERRLAVDLEAPREPRDYGSAQSSGAPGRGFEPPPQRPRAPSIPAEYRPSFHPEFEPFELEEAKSRTNPAVAAALRPQPLPQAILPTARLAESGEVWNPAGPPTAPQDVAAFKQQVKGQVNLLYIVIGVLAAVAAAVVIGIIVLGARGAPENPSTITPLDTGK